MSIDIKVTLHLEEEQYQRENVHLRIISTWNDCITTDVVFLSLFLKYLCCIDTRRLNDMGSGAA